MPSERGLVVNAVGLCALLGLTLLIRIYRIDQPIVENYVGRQIPTAMVARNLDRGMGFLHPQLDTGPFPNYFVVEPPLYEQIAVWLMRFSGLSLEESGRLLSAIGMTLAAWGLFCLVRCREQVSVALLAVLAFSAFPVTIRYGRSFQPDSLMLGFLIMGFALWDRGLRFESNRPTFAGVIGWLLLAGGLAMKVTSAYIFIPILVGLRISSPQEGVGKRLAILTSALLPAIAWYLWANDLVNAAQGSRASADNRAIWLQALAPTALFSRGVWGFIAKYLFWKCFTPLALPLAFLGYRYPNTANQDRLWLAWGASAMAALLVLSAKLHHEYYWLALAPFLAVGIARGILETNRRFHHVGWFGVILFVGLCGYQARSTWETPDAWIHLEAAGKIVQARVPGNARVVAPEALLFQGDRRGCRLEYSARGCRRAAGEWGKTLPNDSAIELVEMYRSEGAHFFADLGVAGGSDSAVEPERVALHEAIRRRYKVIMDLPAILLAELN